MRLFRAFVIISLLATATSRQAEAGVGAKSVQGLFSPDECEAIPELLGQWIAQEVKPKRGNKACRYWERRR